MYILKLSNLWCAVPMILMSCGGDHLPDVPPTSMSTQEFLSIPGPESEGIIAGNIYVSPMGSDANTGTQFDPLRTIQKASEIVLPGFTVHVAPGTYEGGFQTTTDGRADARIRYVSDVKWGAKIVPPANSTNTTAWDNRSSYVDIDGFEIDGTNTISGIKWLNGIYTSGSNTVVMNNRVHHIANDVQCTDQGGSAINTDHFLFGENDDVIGNHIHDIGYEGCPYIHGLYIGTSGKVQNNLVYQVGYAAVHLWHDAANVTISNNTVFGAEYGILIGGGDYYHSTGPADYIQVSNNIVFDNNYGIEEVGEVGGNNSYEYNLVFNNGSRNLSLHATDIGTIQADPLFENYIRTGGGNYHLKNGSPAIKAGSPAYAPPFDIEGKPRPKQDGIDIGAFQYP